MEPALPLATRDTQTSPPTASEPWDTYLESCFSEITDAVKERLTAVIEGYQVRRHTVLPGRLKPFIDTDRPYSSDRDKRTERILLCRRINVLAKHRSLHGVSVDLKELSTFRADYTQEKTALLEQIENAEHKIRWASRMMHDRDWLGSYEANGIQVEAVQNYLRAKILKANGKASTLRQLLRDLEELKEHKVALIKEDGSSTVYPWQTDRKRWLKASDDGSSITLETVQIFPKIGSGSARFITPTERHILRLRPVRPEKASTSSYLRNDTSYLGVHGHFTQINAGSTHKNYLPLRGVRRHNRIYARCLEEKKRGGAKGVYIAKPPERINHETYFQHRYVGDLAEGYRATRENSLIQGPLSMVAVTKKDILQCIRDAAVTADWLHQQDYVHRDLKPQNIFLDFSTDDEGHTRWKGYLADFDFCNNQFGHDDLAFGDDYAYWDPCAATNNLSTPYVDYYGVAVTLCVCYLSETFAYSAQKLRDFLTNNVDLRRRNLKEIAETCYKKFAAVDDPTWDQLKVQKQQVWELLIGVICESAALRDRLLSGQTQVPYIGHSFVRQGMLSHRQIDIQRILHVIDACITTVNND